jgi:anaerobic magnesium-protoporphyrin IX monomethyl ester cyclase
MPDEIGISVSYPLPGTKFFDKVKDQMTGKQNWADSDDLAIMFQGTYPARFYKVLHRYVHNRYRIKRGVEVITKFKRSQRPMRNLLSMFYNLPASWLNARRLQTIAHARG